MATKKSNTEIVKPGLKVEYTKNTVFDPGQMQRDEQAAYEASLKTPTLPPPPPKNPRYNPDGTLKNDKKQSTPPPQQNPITTPPKTYDQFQAERDSYGAPVDEDAIREQVRKQQQARINAINDVYDVMVSKEEVAGEGRLGSQRAIAAKSGTIAQDFGEAEKANVINYNNKSVASINKQRNLDIQEVYSKIDQLTADKVKAQKEEALGKANAYIDYLAENKTQARETIKQAAKAGMTIQSLKDEAPNQLKSLLESTGYTEFELGMYLNSEKPDPVKYEWHKIGNSLVGVGNDPVTGKAVKTVYDATELGIPDAANLDFQTFADGIYYYDKDNPTKDADGNIVFKKAGTKAVDGTPDMKEYEYAKSQGYEGTFLEYQKQVANLKTKSSGGGGSSSGGSTGTTLTKSQLNAAKGKYFAANPGKTEQDFNNLGNDQKYAWYQGGPQKDENTPITKEDIISLFSDSDLRKAAADAGYNKGGKLLSRDHGVGDEALGEYVGSLLKTIAEYEKSGYTRKEILKQLQG